MLHIRNKYNYAVCGNKPIGLHYSMNSMTRKNALETIIPQNHVKSFRYRQFIENAVKANAVT